MEKKRSWICTVVLQVCLCGAFYLALNLGQPQNSIYLSRSTRAHDVYFLSVRGGYRNIKQQIHLLKLMENVAKVYKAKFVVNISELGEDDPLTKNASRLFSSMSIPWYTTRASKSLEVGCFLEHINITDGKILTIAGVDTKRLQDLMPVESMNGFGNNQRNWLTQALETAASNWYIVAGYHPVVVCELNGEQIKAMQVFEPLHNIFRKFGVNAYLSREGCTNHTFQDGISYIGITDPIKKEPNLASLNGRSASQMEMEIVFLLHRVGPLEIETYFVTLTGEVVKKVTIQRRGKEFL